MLLFVHTKSLTVGVVVLCLLIAMRVVTCMCVEYCLICTYAAMC